MTLCPKCGFEVPARAPPGSGSRKGKKLKQLGPNRMEILRAMLNLNISHSVESIKSYLNARGSIKQTKEGKSMWNYHSVQVELSMLVGAGLLEMSKAECSDFDPASETYSIRPVPLYRIKDKKTIEKLLANGGILEWPTNSKF